MDQIKRFFAVFMKYHFWVLTTLVVVIGLVGWYFASGGLAKQFAENKGKVDKEFSALNQIKNNTTHPNDKVIEGVKQQTKQLAQQVRVAWEDLYERQRAEVLRWPEGLGEKFLKTVNALKFFGEIPDKQRERYQYFVKDYFDNNLPKIVDARKMDATGAGLGRMQYGRSPLGGLNSTIEEHYKVIWQDQNIIRAKFDWPDRPSSKMVWLAQEDLWVYEMLLKIIQRTNRDASGPHDAPVKVIEALEIGNEVPPDIDATGRIWDPVAALAAGAGRGGGRAAMMGRMQQSRNQRLGGRLGAAGPVDLSAQILNGRYVDDQGKAIPPNQLTNILEYKRLPVRMLLLMDQRELPRLLVECANAALRVEVEQVRINVGAGSSGGRSGGMGGRSGRGGYGGGRGGYGGASRGGGRRSIGGGDGDGGGGRRVRPPSRGSRGLGRAGMSRRLGGRGASRIGQRVGGVANQDPNLVQVVVQGIVYLYNRPNLAKLGIKEHAPLITGAETAPKTADVAGRPPVASLNVTNQ